MNRRGRQYQQRWPGGGQFADQSGGCSPFWRR